jgi:hypothetical protein
MKILFVAAVAAAVTVPGAPPPNPHMHYEIMISPNPQHLSPSQRLARACGIAKTITAKTKSQNDAVLAFDLSMLRWISCGKPDSK